MFDATSASASSTAKTLRRWYQQGSRTGRFSNQRLPLKKRPEQAGARQIGDPISLAAAPTGMHRTQFRDVQVVPAE